MYCLNPPVAEPPEGNADETDNHNNSYYYHLLSPHYGAGLMLRTLHVLSHLIITVLGSSYDHYHFIDEKTEAQFDQLKFQPEDGGDVS